MTGRVVLFNVSIMLLAVVVCAAILLPRGGSASSQSCIDAILDELARMHSETYEYSDDPSHESHSDQECVKDGRPLPGDHHPAKAGITPPALNREEISDENNP